MNAVSPADPHITVEPLRSRSVTLLRVDASISSTRSLSQAGTSLATVTAATTPSPVARTRGTPVTTDGTVRITTPSSSTMS